MADGPRICMVSGADEIRLRSYVNHTIYARLHDLDYRLECGIDADVTNKFFYKVNTVKRVLPLYDWVVWLDDDVYITDLDRDLLNEHVARAEAEGKFLVIAEGVEEPNGMWSTLNSGVFIIRNDPRSWSMLDALTQENLRLVEDWWDSSEHGIFTKGDQDLLTWYLATTGAMDEVALVSHRELNSRDRYYETSLTDAFAIHFCGYPDKEWGVVRFARRFGIGQELVPDHLLDRFSVRVRSPMGQLHFLARDRWVVGMAGVKARLRPYYRRWQAAHAPRAEKCPPQ